MTKQEYQKRLDEILTKFAEWTIKNVEHGIYIPLPSPKALQAICLLNEEAIGADEEYPTSHANMVMLKMEGQYVRKRNKLRQELKGIIGVSNGDTN